MDAEPLVRPVIEGEGLELVDVTFGREDGRRILRLTVDREGGVDLDTISQLSQKVSRRLDLEGFEPGPYALEVTHAGDRAAAAPSTGFPPRRGSAGAGEDRRGRARG